jgi:hypothetical protein
LCDAIVSLIANNLIKMTTEPMIGTGELARTAGELFHAPAA